ncbi:ABC transporter substrate-binding protein [Desulfosoma caldarium]|uniref:NitT/TauT family transport system substrate-binding protein n=1 Tax=Desulfosoma caldarium TaxID=610254 RepID=A0A3N1VI11_9BACT|nr:ABC transporter substrate-binding protein [Desulfosoma caldarium]ROR01540.1 NitT/TauT family transport system substrate-binding protein [Desulfosoma caldarium]
MKIMEPAAPSSTDRSRVRMDTPLGLFTWGLLLSVLACGMVVPSGNAAEKPLRLGILPVLDTLPLQVAATEGYFSKHGLTVELVTFDSALERDAAMQAGQLEGYFGDMVNTVLMVRSGIPLRMVTVAYASRPGQRQFALVGRPGLDTPSLDAMTSGTVGLSNATIMEYLLDLMEERGLVPPGRFERLEVKKIPVRMQMLLGGRLDLAILPEPLVTLAVSQGARVYVTDENLHVPLTVVGLLQRLLTDSSKTGERFLLAYREALAALAKDSEKYRPLMATSCRIPDQVAATFRIPVFPEAGVPPKPDVERLLAWMRTRGLVSQALSAKDLVWSSTP